MARRVFYSFHYKPDNWRAEVAAERSESLQRAIHCLRKLVDTAGD